MPDPPVPRNRFELMYQDTWWITKDGRELRIDDMDPRHLDNVVLFVERNVRGFNAQCWQNLYDRIHMFADHGDGVEDVFDEILDDLSADDWLERTPLMIRLRAHAARRTEVGKLRTKIHNKTYPLRRRIRRG